MDLKTKDIAADRIKLIYEFNNASPLFARVAYSIINEGNISEAIEILNKGIKSNPDYPSAYFLYAIACAYAGEEIKAKELVKKGISFFPSSQTEEYYFRKIDSIISERNSLNEIKTPAFSETTTNKIEEPEEKIEENLDELAEKLTNAKIVFNPEEKKSEPLEAPEYKGEKIASETLAGIYISQNNYKEAMAVYKELIKKHPDKADYYAVKIAEMQNIIDEEAGIQFI